MQTHYFMPKVCNDTNDRMSKNLAHFLSSFSQHILLNLLSLFCKKTTENQETYTTKGCNVSRYPGRINFKTIFQQHFFFYKLQLQEPYKAALTPKYLIPATLRQIHNPYFTILKSITTLLRCKILKPRIKRIEPGTWATSCTLWLIFQRVLQTPFVGFMGNFSGSLACFGDSTV